MYILCIRIICSWGSAWVEVCKKLWLMRAYLIQCTVTGNIFLILCTVGGNSIRLPVNVTQFDIYKTDSAEDIYICTLCWMSLQMLFHKFNCKYTECHFVLLLNVLVLIPPFQFSNCTNRCFLYFSKEQYWIVFNK